MHSRTCGGSSSGLAALVSAGLVDIGLAGDQGGSIRIPAASCKVISLKPTFGLLPYNGVLGVEFTIDHIGPIANNTEDIARFMDTVAGPDGQDQRYYSYLKYSDFQIDNLSKSEGKTDWEIENKVSYGVISINIDFLSAWTNYDSLLNGIQGRKLKVG
jgi:Asp-tRNA(Asn)/Glu-tRNA(Gln) amidotransferase A subunit family amidase